MTLNAVLLVAAALIWVASAIKPWNAAAWALEQIATLCCVAVLVWTQRYTRYSAGARVLLFWLFACHAVGTHFTYSLTPYDQLLNNWFGFSPNDVFGWQRNHYDRFVHLLYGVAVGRMFQEFFLAFHRHAAAAALALCVVLATSAIYELMEWWAAVVFGGDASNLYLGTQGDIWDAQADIALAGLGALAVLLLPVRTGER